MIIATTKWDPEISGFGGAGVIGPDEPKRACDKILHVAFEFMKYISPNTWDLSFSSTLHLTLFETYF